MFYIFSFLLPYLVSPVPRNENKNEIVIHSFNLIIDFHNFTVNLRHACLMALQKLVYID